VDNQQAKEILSLYRAGLDEASDPFFAEALAQAQRDQELGRWFEKQSAIDAAMREKFQQITAPMDLAKQILTERKIIRPAVWWERPALWAAAAAIIVLAVLAGYLLRQPETPTFQAYRKNMAKLVSGEYKMMLETNDLSAVRQFLGQNHGAVDYVLTKEMEKLPAEGCALITWHGQRVSLVCLDRGHDDDLFLFIVDRSGLPDPPLSLSAEFARVNNMTTASWTVGDKTYVLASKGNEEDLRKFL
jgi:hypothetical protein